MLNLLKYLLKKVRTQPNH